MINSLTFAPIFPFWVLALLAGVIVLLAGLTWRKQSRGLWQRLTACLIVLIALTNPTITKVDKSPLQDIALILVDRSTSQTLSDRPKQIEEALSIIADFKDQSPNLEVRYIEIEPDTQEDQKGTRLIGPLRHALSGIDPERFAGAVLITDGQVHDLDLAKDLPSPLHVLLTGRKSETDRRLEIVSAPRYGVVGAPLNIRVRVLDNGAIAPEAPLIVTQPDSSPVQLPTREDATYNIRYTPEKAGSNFVIIETPQIEGELSQNNNRVAIEINGVRDRLRVLLVSGLPHQGQRTWRNILRSDAAVDLVHFTILRPSQKEDFTPLNELSLIAFPVRELFEEKLDEFDLVIFDRYYKHNVLSEGYFDNIVNYVRDGGAVLVSSGPDFAGPRSLAHTRLRKLLPVIPDGRVQEDRPYRLTRSPTGQRHPITASLPQKEEKWGKWLRLVEIAQHDGEVLLTGNDDKPLLIVNQVKEGRVAVLLSDHIWLWARGFDGGGPHRDLVRYLIHWLMKEPDLEAERLTLSHDQNAGLIVEKRSLSDLSGPVTLINPAGERTEIKLKYQGKGRYSANAPSSGPGLYKVRDAEQEAIMMLGDPDPLELKAPQATAELFNPILSANNGSLHWISDGLPQFKRTSALASNTGKGWIGFKRNHAHAVSGISQTTLFPIWAVFILSLGLWIWGWWREGR